MPRQPRRHWYSIPNPILPLILTGVTPLIQAESIPTYDFAPYLVVAPNVAPIDSTVYRDQVQSAKPVDLAAILADAMPAAALTRKGPLAGDIVLRGFSRDNVLFTVDNNRTYCACPNRMDPPAFHISSQQIESIRVRTGPFDVVEGGAIGGTVAVRTRPLSPDPFATLYGYLGSFDYRSAGLTAGGSLSESILANGGLYFQQGGVYEDGSGTRFTELSGTNYLPAYVDATAFEVVSVETKASWSLTDDQTLGVSYAFQDASDVLYPGLLMDAPTDTMNRASVTWSTTVDASAADAMEVGLAYRHVDHDMRDSFRKSVNNQGGVFLARGYFMRTVAESSFAGAKVVLDKQLPNAAFVRYGLDFSQRLWDADNQIGMMSNDMLPDTVGNTAGFWGTYEHRSGPWALESGLRLDLAQTEARESIAFLQSIRETDTNERTNVLPSLYGMLGRDLTESLRINGGIGFASRLPDPQERYINLNRPMMNPDWIGNPDLDPVQSLEIQGGLDWGNQTVDLHLNAFHAWTFNYIYLAEFQSGMNRATSYENIDARIYGLRGNLGWNVVDALRLEAGLAWQEGIKESLPTRATNDVLGEIPPLRARIAAVFALDAINATAELQFQDDLDRIDPDLGERRIDGWTVLNLSAGYRFTEQFSLSAGIDNVFDQTYAVANGFVRDPFRSGVIVNEPGRFWYFRAGLDF